MDLGLSGWVALLMTAWLPFVVVVNMELCNGQLSWSAIR
jgi:hypothetical protein